MLVFGIIVFVIVAFIYLFMHATQFGTLPSGEGLKKVRASPHYRDGMFQNISLTPQLTGDDGFLGILRKFLFDRSAGRTPPAPLPSVKTDLLRLDPKSQILVWFGHSSYFMQVNGKTILVDPVFSGHASPLRFTTKSFPGSDIYSVRDLPDIDYLFISHDHWDHLDYKTILQLKPKVKKIITAIGVSAHLKAWGYDPHIIQEKDWNEQLILDEGFQVDTISARHFSGRGLKRNRSLWMSFVLTTPTMKIFIGGDSGYDRHFAETGNKLGPFDLVILENGQYNSNWKYIHMTPEESVQAALDLGAKKLLPVHWAKFSLSLHTWDEPIVRIKKESILKNMPLVHPKIGEAVYLDRDQIFSDWWTGIH